jgi:chromosome segregation ATPase
VTGAYEDVLAETRQHVARLQGELAGVREQLASSLATEAQLRRELDTCRTEAAVTATELTHTQRDAAQREELDHRRLRELEERLQEARELLGRAEDERAAVIAALGRRARRRLAQPASPHPEQSESEPAGSSG